MASDNVRSGRTPDQRVATRFPPLWHAVGASVLRLPPGSRVRRAFLERAARTSFEAWVRGDYEVQIYHGPDGYCESMAQWAQSFRNWRAEVGEPIEEAPDRILIVGRHSGEGIVSGVQIEQWGAVRYTGRHGRIVRVDAFFGPDREGVLVASGLPGGAA